MKMRVINYIVACLIFLYFFVIFDVSFNGPENLVYLAYTTSIVEDGDLNAVKYVGSSYPYYLPSHKLGVSKTYNLPDYHNHAGALFWAPFYIYGKAAYSILRAYNTGWVGEYKMEEIAHCAMAFSTALFAFLTLLFTYLFCRIFFSKWVCLWTLLALFLGTPFFYFALFETGNANMLASLFSILSIWFFSYVINMKKTHWFLFGLFFSLSAVIKTELAFQMPAVFIFFFMLFILKKTDGINAAYFLVGLIPGLALRMINDFIKYGTLHVGDFGVLNLKNRCFFEQLFSPYHGFFYTSPVLYICLLGLVLSSGALLRNIRSIHKDKPNDMFFIVLSSYLIIKIAILSFRFAWGGGTPGARVLLTEFVVLALLFARAFQARKIVSYASAVIAIAFIFWDLIVVYEYVKGIDMQYIVRPPEFSVRVEEFKNIFQDLIRIRSLDIKIKFLLPLLLAAFGLTFFILRNTRPVAPSFWYKKEEKNRRSLRIFSMLTVYLFVSYMAVTVLNIYNNQKNVQKLKQNGFFENAEIIQQGEFEKQENIGSMDEMIKYYSLTGDLKRINKIKEFKKELYKE